MAHLFFRQIKYMNTARTEFAQALKAIATERGLDPDVILSTIKEAIIAAYKRDAREQGIEVDLFDYDAKIEPVNGETRVFAWPLPAEDATEKQIEAAKKEKKDVTPRVLVGLQPKPPSKLFTKKSGKQKKAQSWKSLKKRLALLRQV